MSTFEYNDLYLKCQDTGIYHMFVFDIVDSRKIPARERNIAQNKIIELMNRIYEEIKHIEQTTGRQILVFDTDFVSYKSNMPFKGFGFKREPFLFGDSFGFTIYRDSLDTETIYHIYEKLKKELNIDFDFHLANGYYETNDYSEGGNRYFRGYCMDILSTLHKKETINELNKTRKKLNR